MAETQTRRSSDERTGMTLIFLEDLLWGLFPVLTKGLVTGRDPILAAGVASLAASIPFLIYLAWRRQLGELVAPGVRLRLALIALFGQVLSSLCFFTGTSMTSAINASLLSQVEPIYSLILASIFLREAVTRRQVGATLLLVAGAAAVLFEDRLELRIGDLLILLTPLWYQLGHLLAKRLFRELATPLAVPAVRLALGGAILLAIALVRDPGQAAALGDAGRMVPLVAFGLLFIGLEKFLWYEAIRRIDLAKATALLVPSVAVGVLGSFLLLDERLRPGQGVGLLLMVAGLLWLTRSRMITPPHDELPD